MPKKILFASHNTGKIQELQALLHTFHYEIIPQHTLGIQEIEETGLTFVENALLKARHACQHSGQPAIADDSGLVVNVLDGAPGIYSARYAGKQATMQQNIEKLLKELMNVPPTQRQAYFHCTLVYLAHADDPAPIICEGTWHGYILEQPSGAGGFGYDPIFFDKTENCSAAELTLMKKNQLSHRGQALHQLLMKLEERAACLL